jgi:hypothetical protein
VTFPKEDLPLSLEVQTAGSNLFSFNMGFLVQRLEVKGE